MAYQNNGGGGYNQNQRRQTKIPDPGKGRIRAVDPAKYNGPPDKMPAFRGLATCPCCSNTLWVSSYFYPAGQGPNGQWMPESFALHMNAYDPNSQGQNQQGGQQQQAPQQGGYQQTPQRGGHFAPPQGGQQHNSGGGYRPQQPQHNSGGNYQGNQQQQRPNGPQQGGGGLPPGEEIPF